MTENSISFSGTLYGKARNHLTKGILCCPHGDAKFIRTFNKIVKTNPSSLSINIDNTTSDKILIETKEIPEISLFEKIFYRTDKLQKKAIKMRKAGIIDSFLYKINEFEYKHIKKDYSFISKKTLKDFEQNLLKIAPEEFKNFLVNFFANASK